MYLFIVVYTFNAKMAESIGVEPIHPLLDDGLAIRCLAARPTLRYRY